MAAPIGSGYMGDATGGIGQGLAFVLPEGKANTYAMQLAQTHASQLQSMAQQKQAQALKAQQQYESDFKDQKLPEAFAPFDKELNSRHDKWLADAASSYAKTGKNPFNDPTFVAKYNTDILTPARQSKELGANYTKLRAIAETDPGNKYTKESKQSVIDYEQEIKRDPMAALNKPMPVLKETPATVDDLVKTLKPTKLITTDGNYDIEGPNSSNHKAQAFSALLGDPKWHDALKGFGYNPDLPDFGVYTDPKHPNGKRVWYTNPTFTSHQADLILEAPTDPKNANVLKTLGIDPADQYAKEKLQHAIADQNDAMGKAVTSVSWRLDASVEQKTNYTGRKDNLDLRRQDHADLQSQREWQRAQKGSGDYSDFVEKARSGDFADAGRELSNHFENNPAYGKPLVIKENKLHDGKVDIEVPAKVHPNPKYDPDDKDSPKNIVSQAAYTVHLNRNDAADFHSKMAGLIKDAGGDKKINKESRFLNKAPDNQSKLPKQVSSQSDYESLPVGSQYIAPNGKVYIKK